MGYGLHLSIHLVSFLDHQNLVCTILGVILMLDITKRGRVRKNQLLSDNSLILGITNFHLEHVQNFSTYL